MTPSPGPRRAKAWREQSGVGELYVNSRGRQDVFRPASGLLHAGAGTGDRRRPGTVFLYPGKCRDHWLGQLRDALRPPAGATLPYKADLRQENGFILGGDADDVAVENGLKFHIDWLRGQKTGFFVDQRENRSLLEHYAKGKSVLNMFCYTGGFSVYAMRGEAKAVHSVDSSAKAIELTNENIALNFPGDARHEAFCEDAFKYLDEHDQQYDLIVLDPPAFAKHRAALRNALKGYTRLNVKGLQRIKKGGILFTFSCSQVVTKDQFRNAVFTAAAQAGRKVRILHQLHQPADHPINIYHPEGEYLKGLVLYVE